MYTTNKEAFSQSNVELLNKMKSMSKYQISEMHKENKITYTDLFYHEMSLTEDQINTFRK